MALHGYVGSPCKFRLSTSTLKQQEPQHLHPSNHRTPTASTVTLSSFSQTSTLILRATLVGDEHYLTTKLITSPHTKSHNFNFTSPLHLNHHNSPIPLQNVPSPSLQILPHPTKRLSLHTTTRIPPAHTIAPFTPLILLPSLSHALTLCSHCFSSHRSPRACTRCRAVAYCDTACQSAAWSAVHARECRLLRRVADAGKPGLPTPVRAAVQALVVKRIGDGLAGLEGGVEKFRGGEGWADMQMMAVGAVAFAGLETTKENVERAMGYLCKVTSSKFTDASWGLLTMMTDPDQRLPALRFRAGPRRHLPRAHARHGQPLVRAKRHSTVHRTKRRPTGRKGDSRRRRG